jgi:uncharacterized membrane protein
MKYELREQGLGGVLDQAVSLLKDNFGLLFGILLAIMVPLNLAQGFGLHYLMPSIDLTKATPDEFAAYSARIREISMYLAVINIAYAVVTLLIVMPITNGAAIHALSQKYLGKPVSMGSSLGFALKRLPSLLWTSIIKTILMVLGFALLIIPGIILFFRYFVTDQVVVVEGKSGSDALKRSRTLMKGMAGKAFVLSFLLGVLGFLVGAGAAFIPVPEAQIVVRILIQAVLFALGVAAWVVLYFSARCKHESFDLTVLAEQIGAEAPGTSA